MTRLSRTVLAIVVVLVAVVAVRYARTDLRPVPTGIPLTLPPNMSVSIFAKDLPDARVLALGLADASIYVSEPSEGKVVAIAEKDGARRTLVSGLKNPHGLAVDWRDPTQLYVATETEIVRIDVMNTQTKPVHIIDLPKAGLHFTRTLGFGPDDRLYVSIGSTCNVCVETDPRYASIWSLNRDGSDFRQVAKGLRNPVFFAWDPIFGNLWATEMGRDGLGDALPPDEIDVVDMSGHSTGSGQNSAAQNFGWPTCYGDNVHDTAFDKNVYIRNPCQAPFEMPPAVDLPAHVAPLGIAFVPEEGWPDGWGNDAIVAEHGSWNSTTPVGYKLVRINRDLSGSIGGVEDFVTGWLTDKGALGRPVDVLIRPGGTMYVSDDKAGVIYRFTYTPPGM